MVSQNYTIKMLVKEVEYKFNIKKFTGEIGFDRIILEPLIHRLSLAVVGHFELFPAKRLQVCGFTEYTYLKKLSEEERKNRIKDIFINYGKTIPAIIFTAGLEPFPEMIEFSKEFSLPLLGTNYETVSFISELSVILEERLAKTHTVQGVMISVYGVGIIIVGESGVGKSELVIELLRRGHLFVADDIVKVYISASGVLMGRSDDIIKNFIEVRGLGIIDVKSIFGIGTILEKCKVDLIIELKLFCTTEEYDRLGIEKKFTEILGVKIPTIILPVAPGRNVATLIEVAALNFRLQEKGYSPLEELDNRIKATQKNK